MATKIPGGLALRVSPRSSEAKAASAADRGKLAEEQIRKWLDKLALQQHNAIYRLPDARAGSRLPTLADFILCHRATLYLFEVKEVAHDFRLPHGNFDKAQVARMKRFCMAGAISVVLVHHSTTGLWRYTELETFASREGGSWDLSDVPTTTLEDVFGGFL